MLLYSVFRVLANKQNWLTQTNTSPQNKQKHGFLGLKYLISSCYANITSWSYTCPRQIWLPGKLVTVSKQSSISFNFNSGNQFLFGICSVFCTTGTFFLPFPPYILKLSFRSKDWVLIYLIPLYLRRHILHV